MLSSIIFFGSTVPAQVSAAISALKKMLVTSSIERIADMSMPSIVSMKKLSALRMIISTSNRMKQRAPHPPDLGLVMKMFTRFRMSSGAAGFSRMLLAAGFSSLLPPFSAGVFSL